jgi:hypothetical protein
VRSDVLSTLYGHHVDVIHVHDRILVVAGRGAALGNVHHDDLTVTHDEQTAAIPTAGSM